MQTSLFISCHYLATVANSEKKIMESKIYQEVYKTFDRPNEYEILFAFLLSLKIGSYHRFPVARKLFID